MNINRDKYVQIKFFINYLCFNVDNPKDYYLVITCLIHLI